MSESSQTEIEATRGKRAPGRHHWTVTKRGAPRFLMPPRSSFTIALQALYPSPAIGLLAGAKALFPRAAAYTIRDWRRGKRKAPAWARALLREAIDKRLAELQHAKALLD